MLQINQLTCGYGSKDILHDVNFTVKKGAFTGIIGPNGSGKTTCLRAISNILKPKCGNILLDEKDIANFKPKDLARQMAVVPQSVEMSHISVEEFVLLGRIPHFSSLQFFETKEDLKIAKRAMIVTDTFDLKDKPIDEISGGERQLALIARALTQQPTLMLLDEPTAHLDISHQVKILDLLKNLNKELNLTVVMVLHDLNLASEYCDDLILINDGKVHTQGTPQEVLQYEIIEDVYKTVVVVKDNPISAKPFVFIVSEEANNKSKAKNNHGEE